MSVVIYSVCSYVCYPDHIIERGLQFSGAFMDSSCNCLRFWAPLCNVISSHLMPLYVFPTSSLLFLTFAASHFLQKTAWFSGPHLDSSFSLTNKSLRRNIFRNKAFCFHPEEFDLHWSCSNCYMDTGDENQVLLLWFPRVYLTATANFPK